MSIDSVRRRPNPGATRQRAAAMAEEAARELEEDIALGLLNPRERLIEDELMERFDVKRHVVRSALTILEARGAVERRANVGALVRSYSPKEVEDLYDVRELLECSCARSIEMPVTAERLRPVEQAQLEHARAVARRDRREAVRANIVFHNRLFDLSTNRTLIDAVAQHARMSSTIRSITVLSDDLLELARDEHRAMVEAIKDRDSARLAELCAAHLRPSRDAYLRRLSLQRRHD